MNRIDELAELFRKFPGIGPRQAKRFAYFLLSQSKTNRTKLAELISSIEQDVHQCTECFRFFPTQQVNQKMCGVCDSPNRTDSLLLIVEKDEDLTAIEKTDTYNGKYFILGGTVPITSDVIPAYIRKNQLLARLKKDTNITEVIFGLSATPDGDATRDRIKKEISVP